jgi:hypothetical protein
MTGAHRRSRPIHPTARRVARGELSLVINGRNEEKRDKRDKRDTVPAKSCSLARKNRDKRDTVPIIVVATALAIATPAWGHTFPPVHTVVVQVERCEVVLLVGYTAGSGEPTERIVARVASQPKSRGVDALRETLTAYAMAPLEVAIDGVAVSPMGVRAKIGVSEGTRPTVVVLARFSLSRGGKLAIHSKDPRTTRISWQDRRSGRIIEEHAPAQDRWFSGVASFLLPLAPATGGSSCAKSGASPGSATAGVGVGVGAGAGRGSKRSSPGSSASWAAAPR